MPEMKCDPRNPEAWISRYSYRIQLSEIKSALDLCKGTVNRLVGRGCCCPTDTTAWSNVLQPHKMPAGVSNSLSQNGGCCILNRHPHLAESLLPKRESFGQDARLAEKHPIRFHVYGFSGIVSVSRTSPESGTLGFVLCNSLVESTVMPVGLTGLNGSTVLLARVERWFFTSDLLMMVIEAPVVLLLTWKVLVRSEAGTAEGEEEVDKLLP